MTQLLFKESLGKCKNIAGHLYVTGMYQKKKKQQSEQQSRTNPQNRRANNIDNIIFLDSIARSECLTLNLLQKITLYQVQIS